MPITHRNRHGVEYTLFRAGSENNSYRYFFARSSADGQPCSALPDGFDIYEDSHGVVSLVPIREEQIHQEEMDLIRQVLDEHPQRVEYLVRKEPDRIVIYQDTGSDVDALFEIFAGKQMPDSDDLEGEAGVDLSRDDGYQGMLRFTLSDEKRRTFIVERMCFLGTIDDWIIVDSGASLQDLAYKTIPLLGTDDYYDLY